MNTKYLPTVSSVRVTAAVIRRTGSVLIAQRPATDNLALLWEFPGGKMQAGETPRDCLTRELREELDIDCRIGRHLLTSDYEYPHLRVRLFFYEVTRYNGVPTAKEHARLAWVAADRLLQYTMAPADVPMARLLAEHES